MTPFYIKPNKADPMRKRMDEYGGLVKEVAEANGTLFVDTQEAFDRYLALQPSQVLAAGRVHPTLTGHVILARAFLEGIGIYF